MRALAEGNPNSKQSTPVDGGLGETPIWQIVPTLTEGGSLVEPLRILTHPAFPQKLGQGIYQYPFNPHVTRNFIYAPTPKVDVVNQRTLSSTIASRRGQVMEDVVITEIWLGGDRQLSTLAEMARVFHDFWVTPCPIGQFLGWQPQDASNERYLVSIQSVSIGGTGDYEYKEVREFLDSPEGAYLSSQLTLALKLEKAVPLPRGSLTLEGV